MLFDDLKGKQIAKVTTAVPITEELETKVLAKVKELTGKEVTIENIVDESIIRWFYLTSWRYSVQCKYIKST